MGVTTAAGQLRRVLQLTWRLAPGPRNAITDVDGVAVGHSTMHEPARGLCTGVTVIVPPGDLLTEPLPAAVHVINGYGKSAGLVQVAELGEIETPIALTGVFGVGSVLDAFTRRLMTTHPVIGSEAAGRSVNPIVLECNDSYLHDPRAGLPGDAELAAAFRDASGGPVTQGPVGAGVGMRTFDRAGGIGTASREVPTAEGTVGALVLTNFGARADMRVAGRPVGKLLDPPRSGAPDGPARAESGSVIVVIATDIGMDDRALVRATHRVQNGLARTGCPTSHGSGEIALAFATRRAGHRVPTPVLDEVFVAVAECVEEAVLQSVWAGEDVAGRSGRVNRAFEADRLLAALDRERDGSPLARDVC